VLEEPAIDPTPVVEAATTGALMGAAIGESDLANSLDAQPVEALPIVPAPVAVAPAPAPRAPVKVAKAPVAKAVRAEPPPVSARGPEAAVPVVAPAPSAAERAAQDFDSSLADATNALDANDGNLVNRFAPPVDSGPRVTLAAQGFNAFALRPCDNPGAGCQNVQPRQRARPTPAAGGSSIPTP
jgi:hypothetical protein